MWDSFHLFCINEDYYKDKNLSLLEISWFLSPVSWFTSAFFQRWEKTAVPEVKDNATAMELAVNGKVCCDPWPWKLHGWVVVYIFCILTTQNFTEFHSIPDVFFAWLPTIWIYFYVQTSEIMIVIPNWSFISSFQASGQVKKPCDVWQGTHDLKRAQKGWRLFGVEGLACSWAISCTKFHQTNRGNQKRS